MSELKPCSHCGSQCTYPCPMFKNSRVVHVYEMDGGELCPLTGVYDIAAWNHRAEPPVEAGEVARGAAESIHDNYGCTRHERGYCDCGGMTDSLTDIIQLAIDQAHAGQAGKGWVSVEERLPELEETVMVCMADKSVFSSWLEELPEEHSAEDWPPDGVSFPPAWAANEFGEVTHWQPLPAPPEEGS